MKIVFYTESSIGLGHYMRYIAIKNGLERAMIGAQLLYMRNRESDRVEAAKELDNFDPDLVIVDANHFGFLECQKNMKGSRHKVIVLMRWFPPGWLSRNIIENVSNTQYLLIEPHAECPHMATRNVRRIEPIVVLNKNEMFPTETLAENLGLPVGTRICAAVHAGIKGEFSTLDDLETDCDYVCNFDWHSDEKIFATPYLYGAAHILSGAGYNRYWETHWLDLADRTTMIPFCGERLIDDQGARMKLVPTDYRMRYNGADELVDIIANVKSQSLN